MKINQKLVLDLGNSFCKIAIFESNTLIEKKIIDHFELSDLNKIFEKYPNINASIISSVVHFNPEILVLLKSKGFSIELNSKTPIPIINKYSTPETLGKDRLAAAVGSAFTFKGKNVLSIDAGTALKFDFVTKNGEYLGGSISPGMKLRFQSLHTFTDKLPLVAWQDFEELIGKNTEESILSGVIQGITSEIEGVINQYKSFYPDVKVILTGGETIYFDKYIKNTIFALPNLVLTGLYEILKFNEEKK